MPTKFIVGAGKRHDVALEAAKFGKKALLVIDPFFANAPLGLEIKAALEKEMESVAVFSDIQPNPLHSAVDDACIIANENNCDVIIAVGGGSAIDTAKAISIVARYGGKCWDYTERAGEYVKRPDGKGIAVIAIPTTSGTGAEATKFLCYKQPHI